MIFFMHLTKKAILQTLDNPRAKYFTLVNDVLALTTVVSIVAIVLETVPTLGSYQTTFIIIEWVAVVLFTLEYAARVWATSPRYKYVISPFGLVDLAAILPTFLGLGNFSFLKSARVVRIIRFLRLARITKISHAKIENVEETFGVYGFNIALYAMTLLLVILVLGVALHAFVSTEESYWSVPTAMYWAFSVFLGGLPAPIPEGTAGTTIFIITKFCGMALFGLLVGVVSKIFNQLILGSKGK
jgi:voltage-gated potassium channel